MVGRESKVLAYSVCSTRFSFIELTTSITTESSILVYNLFVLFFLFFSFLFFLFTGSLCKLNGDVGAEENHSCDTPSTNATQNASTQGNTSCNQNGVSILRRKKKHSTVDCSDKDSLNEHLKWGTSHALELSHEIKKKRQELEETLLELEKAQFQLQLVQHQVKVFQFEAQHLSIQNETIRLEQLHDSSTLNKIGQTQNDTTNPTDKPLEPFAQFICSPILPSQYLDQILHIQRISLQFNKHGQGANQVTSKDFTSLILSKFWIPFDHMASSLICCIVESSNKFEVVGWSEPRTFFPTLSFVRPLSLNISPQNLHGHLYMLFVICHEPCAEQMTHDRDPINALSERPLFMTPALHSYIPTRHIYGLDEGKAETFHIAFLPILQTIEGSDSCEALQFESPKQMLLWFESHFSSCISTQNRKNYPLLLNFNKNVDCLTIIENSSVSNFAIECDGEIEIKINSRE